MELRLLKPRFWDILPIFAILFCAFVPFFGNDESVEKFVVIKRGSIIAEFPADAETTLEVAGYAGPFRIAFHDGSARVIESHCPNKICVKTGIIEKPGRAIICAPGRIAVIIEGKNGADAITR